MAVHSTLHMQHNCLHATYSFTNFNVLLTVYLGINSCKWPTWRTIILFYNTFVTIFYMFRETSCSSSGGQIVLMEHLV